ncbi:MAG: hypothetical protein II208_01935 [Alphaproteobacteria bacterium]|nr:hypothetical protein [Alphaproteobacteria bacterium]
MIVINRRIFSDSVHNSRGASITEVLLAVAIVALAMPFVYSKILQTNHSVRDIAVARRIMSVRDGALNFVRMNQDRWPDVAQIRLEATELASISPDAESGFIDKYSVRGATITDVYLAFAASDQDLRTSQIARHIGGDAAVVGADGIAYGNTWAVSAPDFAPGDLIYRISRDVSGEDTSKYLHRATSGEDDLNVMARDLDMSYHHVYNVATMSAESARIKNASATFVETPEMLADTVYFSSGANMNGQNVSISDIRVTGDLSGFRNIYATNLNGRGYSTSGRIVTDRAMITNSVNVSNDFVLKSDSSRTISGFAGISASTVLTPYIATQEIMFYDNFGLTISGELLMSTTSPLKVGNWVFPSTTPPQFKEFNLSRAKIPSAPSRGEFDALYRDDWKGQVQILKLD